MAKSEKKDSPRKKMGRPTKYSSELAALICERVATSTMGLGRLCALYDDMPEKITIYQWRLRYPDFSSQYARAKVIQADLLAEECTEIADDSSNDWMEVFDKEGDPIGWRINGDHVQRSRLRIDTRKWLAAKLVPRQYGEHVTIEQKTEENERLKAELLELRKKLDSQNKKDY